MGMFTVTQIQDARNNICLFNKCVCPITGLPRDECYAHACWVCSGRVSHFSGFHCPLGWKWRSEVQTTCFLLIGPYFSLRKDGALRDRLLRLGEEVRNNGEENVICLI